MMHALINRIFECTYFWIFRGWNLSIRKDSHVPSKHIGYVRARSAARHYSREPSRRPPNNGDTGVDSVICSSFTGSFRIPYSPVNIGNFQRSPGLAQCPGRNSIKFRPILRCRNNQHRFDFVPSTRRSFAIAYHAHLLRAVLQTGKTCLLSEIRIRNV